VTTFFSLRSASAVEDLDTGLIDLTSIPLRELRRIQNPELAKAIRQAADSAAHMHANAIQDQRE
jgi:hypothetical protein